MRPPSALQPITFFPLHDETCEKTRSGGQCYDFKKYFSRKQQQKNSKQMAFFVQNTANFCKNRITTLVFKKKRQLFAPKIAQNNDKNIYPRHLLWEWGHSICSN
jgi:hypothetical protein